VAVPIPMECTEKELSIVAAMMQLEAIVRGAGPVNHAVAWAAWPGRGIVLSNNCQIPIGYLLGMQ